MFNVKYGINNLKTLGMLKYNSFEDFYSQHLTQAFLKETFQEVWEKEPIKIDMACHNRFRADSDIGTPICRYWQLLSGKFMPTKKIGKYFEISKDNKKLISSIKKKKYKIICVNDANMDIDFEKSISEINAAFEYIFKEKSSFEI